MADRDPGIARPEPLDGLADDDDLLDGCVLDFTVDPSPDDELDLICLFPQGTDTPKLERTATEWLELFPNAS